MTPAHHEEMRGSTRDARLVQSSAGQQWQARPVLATSVRIAVFALPIVASAMAASVIARVLPHPTSTPMLVLWWSAVLAGSTVVLVVVQRFARRLLPLSALLRLTLLFPDRAPKRFGLALRKGNTSTWRASLAAGDAPQEVEIVLALAAALTAHHAATRGHAERVRAYVELIAEELALSPEDREQLRWASLLHDIGKLSVSSELLGSSAPLDDAGWEVLKQHPTEGARLTRGLSDWLGAWAPTIVQHHERWDGKGYPHGISGEEICLGARITAVADSFEVMTSARPYQRRRSAGAAREELATSSGTQFDPAVVRAFLNVSLGKLERAMGPAAWVADVPLVSSLARILPESAAVVGQVAAAGVVAAAGAVGAMAATGPPPSTVLPTSVEGVTVTRSAEDGAAATAATEGPLDGGAEPGEVPRRGGGAVGVGEGSGQSGGATSVATSDGGGTSATGPPTPTVPGLPLIGPILPTTTTSRPSSPLTLPATTVPTVPTVTLPATTVPTVPTVTLPPTTVPPVTLPPTTVPPVTLPPVTLPPVTVPPVTVPRVTTSTTITLPPTTLR